MNKIIKHIIDFTHFVFVVIGIMYLGKLLNLNNIIILTFAVLYLIFILKYFEFKFPNKQNDKGKETRISKILEYKHIHLILAVVLFYLAYINYNKGRIIWFYSDIIIGTIMIIAYIIRLKQLKKIKGVKENVNNK